jgi:hypothetical protein
LNQFLLSQELWCLGQLCPQCSYQKNIVHFGTQSATWVDHDCCHPTCHVLARSLCFLLTEVQPVWGWGHQHVTHVDMVLRSPLWTVLGSCRSKQCNSLCDGQEAYRGGKSISYSKLTIIAALMRWWCRIGWSFVPRSGQNHTRYLFRLKVCMFLSLMCYNKSDLYFGHCTPFWVWETHVMSTFLLSDSVCSQLWTIKITHRVKCLMVGHFYKSWVFHAVRYWKFMG